MNKQLINDAEAYVYKLLKYTGKKSLYILSEDFCSEVSRLLASWFRQKLSKAEIFVAKGKIKNVFHDLLIVNDKNQFFIIDPTVWQIFKNKKSILIGETDNLHNALKLITQFYSGEWKISEHIIKYSKKEIQEFKDILTKQRSL